MNTKTKLGAALTGTVLATALTATGGSAWAATDAPTAAASPTAVTKLGQAEAANRLRGAGITWSSSGNCTNRNNPTCTSFEQINLSTVQGAITLKNASRCALNITGGTETGHASGTYSHWNGYKLDFNPNTCLSNYITGTFTYIGRRAGDGAPQYQAGSGNIYARESTHWDVLFYTCGC
ncbi:hypothetical protein ACFY1B_34120 [Streptomyces mirabilis]|uniref:hypothetical protein n=1 Tax=Streptomyces mirabilis TaxID=68239 RepID=UPI0036B0B442